MTPWLQTPRHQSWLQDEALRLLAFGVRCGIEADGPDGGGAAYLDEDGAPSAREPVHTWITSRMVHVYALGQLMGVPGCRPVAERAWAGLRGRLRDERSGGWFAAVDHQGPVDDSKVCYAHAFVVLAASSAVRAGLSGAAELLAEATEVFLTRFYDPETGLCVDSWDRDFSTLDPYRGINANMHAVEAMLAAADVTGDPVWLARAAGIGGFVVRAAAANSWRIPEHFDAAWTPLPEYNDDRRDDPFKPYGATVGHALEWSRLLLNLESSGALLPAVQGAADWLAAADWSGAAAALFDQAVRDGWAVDGADGFVYTTDWDGTPVVRDRMHWVAAEATAAAAALWARTGEAQYASAYERWWDYTADVLIDRERGSWHHQLDPSNRPIGTVWPGKPDLYHAFQSTLFPRLPLAPTLATAVARGLLT